RLGYNEDNLEEWLPQLLEMKPAVITVHARTKKEMSKVPARWERIKRAVEIAEGSGTLIIGNGDVTDLKDARKKVAETGADGVMLGRAIFGNPWLFADVARARRGYHSEHPASSSLFDNSLINHQKESSKNVVAQSRNSAEQSECATEDTVGEDEAGWSRPVTVEKKLQAVIEHTKLFEEVWASTKSFELMKKHYQAYINNFPEAKELRMKMMECHTAQEIESVINNFLVQSRA
ncbi:MAG: tRNA-dihydrouridine synthase, partial [Candidatus Moraniibacteriota bacterium]